LIGFSSTSAAIASRPIRRRILANLSQWFDPFRPRTRRPSGWWHRRDLDAFHGQESRVRLSSSPGRSSVVYTAKSIAHRTFENRNGDPPGTGDRHESRTGVINPGRKSQVEFGPL